MFVLIAFFIFGAFFGSFLNVLVDRLSQNENPFVGRSHCDNCKKTLKSIDLVPIFSYLFLSGRCRYCKKRISSYYPTVEISTGALFATILFFTTKGVDFVYSSYLITQIIYYLSIGSIFIVIFFSDLKYGIIPLYTVVLGSFFTLIGHLFLFHADIITFFLSGIACFLGFLFLFAITKGRGIGFGDVAYAFLMGLILGYKVVLGLYITFISGAVVSLTLVLAKKKKIKGGTIPFGPFLVAGTLISLVWGDAIIKLLLPYLLRY